MFDLALLATVAGLLAARTAAHSFLVNDLGGPTTMGPGNMERGTTNGTATKTDLVSKHALFCLWRLFSDPSLELRQ